MTLDPDSVAELAAALAALTDSERAALEYRVINVACHFADVKMSRVAAVFHAVGVLVAEEADRRAGLVEHARGEMEGREEGALVTDLAALLAAGKAELLAAAQAEATAEHGDGL